MRGLDALHAGLWMLPMAVPMFLCAPLSGRLVGTPGAAAAAADRRRRDDAERALFALFDAETSNVTLFIGYVLFGIGFGFVNAPITNTAVSGMPRAQAGVAAAVASTSRQLGQTLGVAVVGRGPGRPGSAAPRTGRRSSPRRGPGGGSSPGAGFSVLVLGGRDERAVGAAYG